MENNIIPSVPLPDVTIPLKAQNAQKAAVPTLVRQASKATEQATKVRSEPQPVRQEAPSRQEPLTNLYVVNDKRFTIFKDALGYVTRYTSLVDNRVTYVPDQDVARFLEAQQRAQLQARVNIDA